MVGSVTEALGLDDGHEAVRAGFPRYLPGVPNRRMRERRDDMRTMALVLLATRMSAIMRQHGSGMRRASIVSQCRAHMVPRSRPVVRRRYSHARAVCHSRVTVARDTESTAATSCSDQTTEVPELDDLALPRIDPGRARRAPRPPSSIRTREVAWRRCRHRAALSDGRRDVSPPGARAHDRSGPAASSERRGRRSARDSARRTRS